MKWRSGVSCLVVIVAVLAGSLVAEAQPGKVPRIGVLLYVAAPAPGQSNPLLDAFRGGLRDLGLVDGQHVILESRWAGGSDQRAAGRQRHGAEPSRHGTGRQAHRVAEGSRSGAHSDRHAVEPERSRHDPRVRPGRGGEPDASTGPQSLAVREPGEFPGALQAAGTGRTEALIVTAQPFTVRHQVGEERGGQAPADGSPYWLVDPICGTRNFASGIPLYCVNLALVERGEITVAVVGDASTGGIDVAERGRGAWRLRGSDRERLTTRDDSRVVVVEDGKSKGSRRERAARFTAAAIRADRWDVRSLGTTLASPYVAAGRVAAYVVFLVSAVHTGAGSLLITEAGGTVSDVDGRPWTIESDSLIGSAHRRLHEELLDLARADS